MVLRMVPMNTQADPSARAPEGIPGGDPTSALPSVMARVVAFMSIFVGAGTGGMIGHTFADLGGFSSSMVGLLTFVSMLLGAGGVAVIAVLTLRAFGEWETIRDGSR